MTTGERIKKLRLAHKLTTNNLAQYLLMTYRNYLKYENNTLSIALKTGKKLAQLYNISIDYIAELDDNPFNENTIQNEEKKIFNSELFPILGYIISPKYKENIKAIPLNTRANILYILNKIEKGEELKAFRKLETEELEYIANNKIIIKKDRPIEQFNPNIEPLYKIRK